MRFALAVLLILTLCGLAYIRLAPSDVRQWHTEIEGTEDADFAGGALRVAEMEAEALARADAYMQSLPRTRVLTGSVESGRVTYVTRSKVFGFPDYTTVEYTDGLLKAYARLRFGQSDLGVNRERLEGLFAALQG
jgi:uncharacterized protein (DUF1499 family)